MQCADPKILEFISTFRRNIGAKEIKQGIMTPAEFAFHDQYSGCFAHMLERAFPGGTILWETPYPRAVYTYKGKMYDIMGAIRPKDTFYLELKWAPNSVISILNGRTTDQPCPLDVMEAVNKFRDTIRKYITTINSKTCPTISIDRLKEIARVQLCHDVNYTEAELIPMLHKTCINANIGKTPESVMIKALTAMTETTHPLVPWYPPIQKDAADTGVVEGPGGKEALASVIYESDGSARCVLTSCDGYGTVIAGANLSQTEKGFAWNISAWYNNMTYDRQHQKGRGWGKMALKLLAENLANDYGMPTGIAYTWNGQEEQVGRLVTEKWRGICRTPAAILKNESADSWDSHIYDLNIDAFMDWLCEK